MANISLHDEDGNSWITNRGDFRMPHPTRVGLFFEPGQPTKVNTDAWIQGQPVLAVTDMLGDDITAAEEKPTEADKADKTKK